MLKSLRTFFVAGAVALSSNTSDTKALAAESLGEISLNEIAPRIVTPNGDMLNDEIFFRFSDSVVGLPMETTVVDINGAKISELHFKSGVDDAMTWDGKDSGGRSVPSGVYIYSIKLGAHQATGTVVVAR